jgi:ATP-dependent Clp protease ATP-binding subunit ClpA
MFERLTPPARRVLVVAQEQARNLGQGFIDTEHLLLGLLAEADGTAARALQAAGVDADAVRTRLAGAAAPMAGASPGPLASGNRNLSPAGKGAVPFTRLAEQALEWSLREALALRDDFIGTEHLLLALVRQRQSGAVYLIREQGVDPARVSADVLRLLMEAGHPPPRSTPRMPRPRTPRVGPRLSRRKQWPGA